MDEIQRAALLAELCPVLISVAKAVGHVVDPTEVVDGE